MDNKESSFSKYQKKNKIENIFKSLFFATFASFAFAIVINGLLSLLNLKIWWIILILTVLAFVGTFFLGFKKLFIPKDSNMAQRVDNFGLQDRAVTMVQFKDCDSVIARKQREDAEEKIETVEFKQVKFKFPKVLVISAGVALVIGVGSYFLPERVPEAVIDRRTSYTVTFNSNGGKFNSQFLFDNNYDESKKITEDVFDDKGVLIQTNEIITCTTELTLEDPKALSANYFANNEGIEYHGYSLIGWNTKVVNSNGTPVTTTLDYMSGVLLTENTTFYAIWQSIDEIIKDLLDDLREIVDGADVNPTLKDELNQEIDQFEQDITQSDMSNQDKIDTTKDFQASIIEKLENAKEEAAENNKDAADVLIQGGQQIGSEALENLGNSLKDGDKSAIDDALDEIIKETEGLEGEELKDRLDEITGVIDDAADAAANAGNQELADALGNLSNNLKEAGESASNGNNEGAQEQIKDAIEQAKDELGMTAGEAGNIGDTKEEIDEAIKEAIGKLEGQTGLPSENQPITPPTGDNPTGNSGDGMMSTNNPTGNSGTGLTSTNNPTGNSGTGLTSTNNPTGNSGTGLTSTNNPTGNSGTGSAETSNPTGNSTNNHTPGSGDTSNDTGNGAKPSDEEKEYETVLDGTTSYKDYLTGSKEEIYAKLESGEIPSEYVEIIKNYLQTLENE